MPNFFKNCKLMLLLPLATLICLFIWYDLHESPASTPQAQDNIYPNRTVPLNSYSIPLAVVLNNTRSTTDSPRITTLPSNRTLSSHLSTVLTVQNLCHEQDSSKSPADSSNKILIIGASSFIGANVAWALYKANVPIIATEDSVNIGFDPLTWYRWEQLIGMGVSPQYVDYGSRDVVTSTIKKHSPKAVVYIPSPFFDKQLKQTIRDLKKLTTIHENFLRLLETCRKESPSTRIILISNTGNKPNYSSLIKLFELSLSAYNRLYNTNIIIIQATEEVYGPWQSGTELGSVYIDDFTNTLIDALSNIDPHSQCLVAIVSVFVKYNSDSSTTNATTRKWITDYSTYIQRQTKGVIASTYITTRRNAQYAIVFNNNNYYFMENWFKNIYKMNLDIAVFHDDLSKDFISTFNEQYPKSDFVKITNFKNQSPNDRRFAAYYDYILSHPEISHFLMTDMRDVQIQNNPFEVLQNIGDYIYVGIDEPFKYMPKLSYLPKLFSKCFHNLNYNKELQELGFFNAGAIAGSRYAVLAFLTRFQHYLDKSSKQNCNMAVVEYIFHKYFYEDLYYGWPFNAGFLTHRLSIPGLAVLHKWSLSSYN